MKIYFQLFVALLPFVNVFVDRLCACVVPLFLNYVTLTSIVVASWVFFSIIRMSYSFE